MDERILKEAVQRHCPKAFWEGYGQGRDHSPEAQVRQGLLAR
jgi:hypothetical protein